MLSMNRAEILGNIIEPPRFHETAAGHAVANLNVATNSFRRADDGRLIETGKELHRVTIYDDRTARLCRDAAMAGDLVLIIGQLHTRKFVDSRGIERASTEIAVTQEPGHLFMIATRRGDIE